MKDTIQHNTYFQCHCLLVTTGCRDQLQPGEVVLNYILSFICFCVCGHKKTVKWVSGRFITNLRVCKWYCPQTYGGIGPHISPNYFLILMPFSLTWNTYMFNSYIRELFTHQRRYKNLSYNWFLWVSHQFKLIKERQINCCTHMVFFSCLVSFYF